MLTGPEAGITRDSIPVEWKWRRPRRCGWSIPPACAARSRIEAKLEALSVADTLDTIRLCRRGGDRARRRRHAREAGPRRSPAG